MISCRRVSFCWLLIVVVVARNLTAAESDDAVIFREQIAPIFREHCLRCHRPGNAKGDISLSTFKHLDDGDHVIKGDSNSSYLLELIRSNDGAEPEMPRDGEPLSNQQIDLIRRWIDQGAKWPSNYEIRHQPKGGPDWWAFQPLADLKGVEANGKTYSQKPLNASQAAQTIDTLVDARLNEADLKRNLPADRRTLIRRATYDLIGLPPTPIEIEAFLSDERPDAYEQLIERLLASPHYGERWGRHWLDVVRFGESNGFERNVIIGDLWPFRDYVIRSFNQDKPFDQLIHEHLAGDVIAPNDPKTKIGSAFLVAGPYDNVGNQDPVQKAQIRANTLDEMIRASSEAFLGLTIGCARCHDHKFDPITQDDYYSLYATFSGVTHGSVVLASKAQQNKRAQTLKPLNDRRRQLETQQKKLREQVLARAEENLDQYQRQWTRPAVDRTGTTETFPSTDVKFVRLTCQSQDTNVKSSTGWRIDEFQVWTDAPHPINVALASNGAVARGKDRKIEDFPGAYGPHLAIDGKSGARFLSVGKDLTIELADVAAVNRVVFSSAIGAPNPEHRKFVFLADYRIDVSLDGKTWTEVANSNDRAMIPPDTGRDSTGHRQGRLFELAVTETEREQQIQLQQSIADVNREINSTPKLQTAWIGTRNEDIAKGPFHVFLGGSPQKPGNIVSSKSLSVFANPDRESNEQGFGFQLPTESPESARRLEFAKWLTHRDNPLTPRVMANRLWHYHFGTGIVSTPSDFGFMGEKPSHPTLLDFLARQLQNNQWKIKPIHRMIMMSATYRQSSKYREDAAAIDGDARLLWRFRPRRLSAEEIRDTILQISGSWNRNQLLGQTPELQSGGRQVPDGGPGFRLYHYMQDNVSTYKPLDHHDKKTYRRAIYHQNARASVVDLMTEFDQPDCAFSTPRRVNTTTPLQALTMMNHSFTTDMAGALSRRLKQSSKDTRPQIQKAFQLGYAREPDEDEIRLSMEFVKDHGMDAYCRVFLNTSELIYVQ